MWAGYQEKPYHKQSLANRGAAACFLIAFSSHRAQSCVVLLPPLPHPPSAASLLLLIARVIQPVQGEQLHRVRFLGCGRGATP